MNSPYHYIGLDIHKQTVSFCEKGPDGSTVDAGKISARRNSLSQWAQSRTTPWLGARGDCRNGE